MINCNLIVILRKIKKIVRLSLFIYVRIIYFNIVESYILVNIQSHINYKKLIIH
ncbi:hypothetical protein CLAUR_032450 [Clostridium felsineum]|nr:hypothetical protein CLAUR_032450 [Clostridium felsineum]